jgi:hypothetical protein
MVLLSLQFSLGKKRLYADIHFLSQIVNNHENVQKQLISSTFLMLDRLIPIFETDYTTPTKANHDLVMISCACFWIVCKFNIDCFSLSYTTLDQMTNIPWRRFVETEKIILETLDYKLWEFMEEPVLTRNDSPVSNRVVLASDPDDVLWLKPVESNNRVCLKEPGKLTRYASKLYSTLICLKDKFMFRNIRVIRDVET